MTVGIFDQLITLGITLSQSASELQQFGVLYLPAPGSCSFTETVKRYSSPTEVTADLADSKISATTAAALSAAFGLDRRPAQIAVGKIPAGAAQEILINTNGTVVPGEVWSVTVDDVTASYTTVTDDTYQLVSTELAALLVPLLGPAGAGTHTVTDDTHGTFTITSDVGTNPSQVTVATDSASGTMGIDESSTDATTPSSALDTLLAADGDWYALATELKGAGWQDAVDGWCETNKRYFWAQTSDARLLTNDAAGIAAIVKAATQDYTSVIHHDDDAEECALLGLCRWLSFSPDLGATSPTKMQLKGITINEDLTTSLAANLDDDYVGYYHKLKGTPCLSAIRTGSGMLAKTRLLIDWLDARIGEAVARLFLNAAAKGRPIPYTDAGFAQVALVVQKVLDDGVALGWLRVVLDPNTNQQISPVVTVPRRSAVSTADATALRVPVTFVAHDAAEVLAAGITGHLEDAIAG